jgi:23S rRNA (pseudouridine1915-N3)-methyltransferase
MKIILLLVGKTNEGWIQTGTDTYVDRLRHYAQFELVTIVDVKAGKRTADEIKHLEGEAILKAIQPGDQVILLDEKGRQYGSTQFAKQLQKWMNAAPRRLVFVVGGAFGFSAEVIHRANGKLSLSPMTFTHQMVRPFFVEQLYRAFSILRGEKYHNE